MPLFAFKLKDYLLDVFYVSNFVDAGAAGRSNFGFVTFTFTDQGTRDRRSV